MPKATPKPECVGHIHPQFGRLVEGVVYDVEVILPEGPFQPVPEPESDVKRPPKHKAEKE